MEHAKYAQRRLPKIIRLNACDAEPLLSDRRAVTDSCALRCAIAAGRYGSEARRVVAGRYTVRSLAQSDRCQTLRFPHEFPAKFIVNQRPARRGRVKRFG